MQTVITPDNVKDTKFYQPHVFLAGSIEQGTASNWQDEAIKLFEGQAGLEDLVIVNPRRDTWDSTLEQSASNPVFNHQVTFELDYLESVDAVLMWFEPGTKSPISLLELGLLAGQTSVGILNRLVVGCPPGFWRKGNVDIVCKRFNIKVVESVEELVSEGAHLVARNFERRHGFIQYAESLHRD